ncbi:MAG: sigma-70 family RNA polymerase sigma factor [Burkholderiales bacterium]|nr:sigma-70 family RNA polymerase sigma factor [Anaerolineae bacterium]
MSQIAARDQQAFHVLYDDHGKAVYSLAYRILQNSTLAEEVTQDTFLKVWRQTTNWDPEKGKLRNWLLTITQFTAIDRLRRERRQPMLDPDPIEDTEETTLIAGSALQWDIHWQEGTALRMLVGQLPAEQARLIDLAFFHGMSHSEIASETQIPLGTVKTRLRTGIQRLRELWGETVNRTSNQA